MVEFFADVIESVIKNQSEILHNSNHTLDLKGGLILVGDSPPAKVTPLPIANHYPPHTHVQYACACALLAWLPACLQAPRARNNRLIIKL